MTERAKQAQREYQRAWRARNRDRVKIYNERQAERLADKMGIPREGSGDQSEEG